MEDFQAWSFLRLHLTKRLLLQYSIELQSNGKVIIYILSEIIHSYLLSKQQSLFSYSFISSGVKGKPKSPVMTRWSFSVSSIWERFSSLRDSLRISTPPWVSPVMYIIIITLHWTLIVFRPFWDQSLNFIEILFCDNRLLRVPDIVLVCFSCIFMPFERNRLGSKCLL